MDDQEPRPTPPAPPRPEWLTPPAQPPSSPALTPMMDFFQRRVEALERELTLERERAQSAQGLLSRQDALKAEVESHMRAISDQLKREKGEREGEEARSHARGRIETLEKRLDEMNATFAQLLKESVSGRQEPGGGGAGGPSAGALAAELASFRAALRDAVDGVARTREELRELAAIAPRVQELSERLPQDEKLLTESVGRRVDALASGVTRALDEMRRVQEAERGRLDERVEALARERADLARLWDEQARSARESERKDRSAREAELSRRLADLAARLEAVAAGQQGAASGSGETRALLERALSILTATPKAKDEVIAALEAEKAELMTELRGRHESLRRFAAERAAVEKSLGDGLLRMTEELEGERARTREAEARAAALLGKIDTLSARAADLERAVGDRDERARALAAERDEIALSLLAEAEKYRRALAERRELESSCAEKEALWRKTLDEAAAARAGAEASASEARAQLGTLAGQSARAFQERDATLARFAEWDAERRRLLETLRKKDEMISLLSATFQGALKKEG